MPRYLARPPSAPCVEPTASVSRCRALRWCAKACLLPFSPGEYPATRTRSVSEAETEDDESYNDLHHDAALRMQECEALDLDYRHLQVRKAFDLKSKAVTASARRAAADRLMETELLDLFDVAKKSGYVVEVGPHELDTYFETQEGVSEAFYVRSPRHWLSAVRFLPLLLAFTATFC